MGERREDPRGVPPEAVRSPRVVLVMVECLAADALNVEALATQWAQEVRFRVLPAAETCDARAVVVDGSLDVLASAFRMVGEGLRA
jgi:hypothetical protein